jgi:hypothetical protein
MRFSARLYAPLVVPVLLLGACGGDDDDDDPAESGSPSAASPTTGTIEEQLESILLNDDDVPDGLEGSGLAYSTNEQLAGSSEEELQRLNLLGRQLGVDLTFIPTAEIPMDTPGRGGIQNSASVYTNVPGASETFKTRIQAARTNDWAANYADLNDVKAAELQRPLGDESVWVRVTGLDECEADVPPGEPSPTIECRPRLTVIDHVLVRAGRNFIYLSAVSDTAAGSIPEVFAGDIQRWVQVVVDRARETFPVTQ